jgi:hypothetical protein
LKLLYSRRSRSIVITQKSPSTETSVTQPVARAVVGAHDDVASPEVKPPRRANETHLRRRAEIFLRLREVCKSHSASELAELTGTNYETVRRHLADSTAPSSTFLSGLCDALAVSAEWLLCGRGEMYRQGRPATRPQDKVAAVHEAATDVERHMAKLADDVR